MVESGRILGVVVDGFEANGVADVWAEVESRVACLEVMEVSEAWVWMRL